VIIDFSRTGDGTARGPMQQLLQSTSVKARILRLICSMLNIEAEQMFHQGHSLNTLVVFDEAQRFAAENPEDDESKQLANSLVDYVRTTRKYGLGWTYKLRKLARLNEAFTRSCESDVLDMDSLLEQNFNVYGRLLETNRFATIQNLR
jgi:hypothetical protein